MEGDCNVYAHSSLWMRPTGEWSINAKMVYIIGPIYLVSYIYLIYLPAKQIHPLMIWRKPWKLNLFHRQKLHLNRIIE